MKEPREKHIAGSGNVGPLEGNEGVSFVLALWAESREAGAGQEWRWRVVHVQSGEQAYFNHLSEVLAFVASESGIPAPD